MSQFYNIDSTRVSFREFWWWSKSPAVLITWLLRLLRVRIPCSSDDPNVDFTLPFVTDSLPPAIEASFQPLNVEFTNLGFLDPLYQVFNDAGTRTTIYWATYRHASGKHSARIHHRVWQQAQKPSRALFPLFFTAFSDGTFLISSAGKPDLAAPNTVQMNRMQGAKPPNLWAAHEQLASSLTQRKMISPVTTREELQATSERYHLLVRDFHLVRGVFRLRTAVEKAKADAFADSVTQAQAGSLEHAEVLAELEQLQTKKPGWGAAIWILAGTLIAFLAAGAAQWDWKFTLWIIPVLLLHESGHWIAMRLFHYRNLRMFFIPFFGAAVTGQNWNVPGWKKALVSLAGPVPGIGLGIVLGIAGLVLRQPAFNKAALVLLFLNGLNLLPILPLDGGHVLQDTLFCRNRWLDGAFRILAIFGLAGFGMFLGAKVLPYLAIPMAIALPIVFKLGKVTDDIRRQPLPPPLPGEDRIPVPTAQAIIKAIRESFPAKITLSNKVLAQHTLNVFERLNAKPPGPLATLALLAVHGGALFAALLVAGLLVIAGHGGLGDFFAAAIRQPQHFFRIGDVQTWPAVRQGDDSGVRTLVATTLKNRAAADAAFVELTNRVPPASALTRVGDSLLLSLPADDDGAREHWFDEFQGRSTNTFVALSNSPVAVSLACVAPTKTVVTNVTRELRTYFATASEMHLIAPWSPEAKGADFAGWSLARQQWAGIEREVAGVWRDPSLKSYQAKITAALKRGTLAEAQRLEKEHAQKLKDLQTEARERLRTESPRRFDPVLVDLYSTLNGINWTNREARKAVFRELAGKLGEVPYTGDRPVYGADAYGVDSGTIAPHGLFIELRWVGFRDVTRGLPAMTDWLSNQGCRQFKYELEGSGFLAELDERDD